MITTTNSSGEVVLFTSSAYTPKKANNIINIKIEIEGYFYCDKSYYPDLASDPVYKWELKRNTGGNTHVIVAQGIFWKPTSEASGSPSASGPRENYVINPRLNIDDVATSQSNAISYTFFFKNIGQAPYSSVPAYAINPYGKMLSSAYISQPLYSRMIITELPPNGV